MRMLALYRLLTTALHPLIPLYLRKRLKAGKEDRARMKERLGFASEIRPAGQLIWLHAASVGEAQSVLPLIGGLKARYPKCNILITTGTVTSAQLMRERLPQGVIHQYVPIDTPIAVNRFIRHWQPNVALWVESELWPNLLFAAHQSGARMALVNARMSARSYLQWQRFGKSIRALLGVFRFIIAQSEADQQRYAERSLNRVICLGNLKNDAPALPVNAAQFTSLQAAIGIRPFWLSASIHPGEEIIIAKAHRQLRKDFPQLLTIMIPRHPQKGAAMAEIISEPAGQVALRSRAEPITADTHIYIADTLGELGTFYALSGIVFIGGSLVSHGGQNPLEAARLRCALLFGRHMSNFEDCADALVTHNAAILVDEASLAPHIGALLTQPALQSQMADHARTWVDSQTDACARVLDALNPLLTGDIA